MRLRQGHVTGLSKILAGYAAKGTITRCRLQSRQRRARKRSAANSSAAILQRAKNSYAKIIATILMGRATIWPVVRGSHIGHAGVGSRCWR